MAKISNKDKYIKQDPVNVRDYWVLTDYITGKTKHIEVGNESLGIGGVTGVDTGIGGIPILTGALYTWLKGADDASGTNMTDSLEGKAYIGLAINKLLPESQDPNSLDPTYYFWNAAGGAISYIGADGKTYWVWIKYADNQYGTDMSDDSTGMTYIGLAINKSTPTESTDPNDYEWSLILSDIVQQPKIVFYWIKFADDAIGTNMSDSSVGKAYMGIATDKETPIESDDYTDYFWNPVQGDKGYTGADGKTYYVWDKWANSNTPTPSEMSDDPDGKTYLGLAINKELKESESVDSTDYTQYTWTQVGVTAENILIERTSQLENDGEIGDDKYVQFGDLAKNSASIENRYLNIDAMLADQGNQTNQAIQYVNDATDDPTVDNEGVIYAYYEYLGTTVGDLTDYRKLTDEEILDLIVISKTSQLENDGEDGVNPFLDALDVIGSTEELIDVTATWIPPTGFAFDCTARKFPVFDQYYSAVAGTVTAANADATLDRIDTIVASRLGVILIIPGTLATTQLVVPPNIDYSLYYPIKNIIVRALATKPEGVSSDLIYNEGVGPAVEWAVTLLSGVARTANDAYNGAESIEGTAISAGTRMVFVKDTFISTADIDSFTFWWKNKDLLLDNQLTMKFFDKNGAVIALKPQGNAVKQEYKFGDGKHGLDGTDITTHQKITINMSSLNLQIADLKTIWILPYTRDLGGFFFDLFNINSDSSNPGSTAVTNTSQLINDGEDGVNPFLSKVEGGTAADTPTQANTIKLKTDTAADWTSEDPTLALGEIGIETDTAKKKIGDGVTAWTALLYDNTALKTIFATYLTLSSVNVQAAIQELKDELDLVAVGAAKPPIEDTYADIAALLADQGGQDTEYLYEVTDASTDPNVTAGIGVYHYLGVANGVLATDYHLAWKAETARFQTAAETSFSPYLTLASAEVQAVIQELKDEVDIIGSNLQKEVTAATYTMLTGDNNYTIFFNRGTAITVTVDDDLVDNFECSFYNLGVGTVTFAAGTATLGTPDGTNLKTDKVGALIKFKNNNNYKLKGEFI